jgi:HAE1 family hydrophobic/amphiphilic exporter-1
MIFGMVPVAFGVSEGSELRAPMGQTVIGGLVTSTLLTLFVVPVVYTFIEDASLQRVVHILQQLLPRARVRPLAEK